MLADYFGIEVLSMTSGISFAFAATGYISGPPIAGAIFDATGKYLIAAELGGGLLLLAFAIVLFLPRDGTYRRTHIEIYDVEKVGEGGEVEGEGGGEVEGEANQETVPLMRN